MIYDYFMAGLMDAAKGVPLSHMLIEPQLNGPSVDSMGKYKPQGTLEGRN